LCHSSSLTLKEFAIRIESGAIPINNKPFRLKINNDVGS